MMLFGQKKDKIKKIISVLIAGLSFFVFSSEINLEQVFAAVQSTNPEIPKIISRKDWKANESLRSWKAEYAPLEKFILHHTGSANLVEDPDGKGTYKNAIQAIYRWHTKQATWFNNGEAVEGFGDIGYNYLIDPNGNIYEGRYGGNGVVGGHAYGFNRGSVGISVIGTYGGWITESSQGDYKNWKVSNNYVTQERYNQSKKKYEVYVDLPVNKKIQDSLEKLIGWIASNNNIDLDRKSSFWGKQIYGLAGHRDVDNTNCPGDSLYSLLGKIRTNAKSLALRYKNYAYRVPGETTIWVIENGRRKGFSSQEIMASQGYDSRKIINISRKQLEAYSTKLLAKYPNGSLLRAVNSSTVYLIEQGKKRPFKMTSEQFSRLGFKWSEIKNVSLEDLTAYSDGQKIKYGTDNELVTTKKNFTVYLIENGKRRPFTSATLFNKLGYDWSKIKIIEDEEMESFLVGEKMKYPNRTLIRDAYKPTVYFLENGSLRKITSPTLFKILGFDWQEIITTTSEELAFYSLGDILFYPNSTLVKSKTQPTVYLISVENPKTVKREFTSAELFEHLGYDWSRIIEISQEELDLYPIGKPMLYKDGVLLRAENSPTVYLIENGQKRKIGSLEIFTINNFKWKNVIVVSEKEIAFYPLGQDLKYPDGTLIKKQSGNKVYLIKNGQGEWIKSAEEFKSAGYKWEDIIELSQEEFSQYVESSKDVEDIGVVEDAASDENVEDVGDEENENVKTDKTNIQEPIIRIAICSIDEGETVSITGNGVYDVQDINGSVVTKSANEISNVVYSESTYAKFVPKNSETILQITSYNDPNWNNTANYNQFRGSIEIKYSPVSKKLWVINELPLEDYLKGVAECCQNDPEEYIKAMALAARTYAYYHLSRGGKYGSDEIFHLKNSTADQLYKGYGREILASDIIKAVDKTQGEIIIYNDSPIVSAYSSGAPELMTIGTKSACKVWGGQYCQSGYEYLAGGAKDPIETFYNYSSCGDACHCVGLSGVGARQMALNGKTYREILKHYYPGTEIEKKY